MRLLPSPAETGRQGRYLPCSSSSWTPVLVTALCPPHPDTWICLLSLCFFLPSHCSYRVQLFRSHGLQQARPPCPSPTPGVYSNSCPFVRKHLAGGFLCAVLNLSGILCSLLIPEYSGIERQASPGAEASRHFLH